MGFILQGLDKDAYDRSYSDRELFKRIAGYFSKYKRYMAIVAATVVLTSAMAGAIPYILSLSLNSLESNKEAGHNYFQSADFYILISVILLFYIISFVSNAVSTYFGAKSTQLTVVDIRQDVFDKLLSRDMSFFEENPTGRIVSRVINDTTDFGQTVSLSTNLASQVLTFLVVVIFLFYTSVRLTIILLLFIPVIFITSLSFRKYARKTALASHRLLAKINALIQESTSGVYVAKSFGAEETIYEEFTKYNNSSYDANLRRGMIFNSIFPILSTISYLAIALITYFGGVSSFSNNFNNIPIINLLPSQEITGGTLYLFLQGLTLFFFPLVQIASFWSQFQQGLAGAERVFSVMDAENQIIQTGNEKLDDFDGSILFQNLTFGYNKDIKIFENFSLKVEAGERIAIVGHTGAGKSTINKLIGRYYEFQSGKLLVGGKDIRSLELRKYRRHLGIISQEVFLWNTSIKENILYGVEYEIAKPKKQENQQGNNENFLKADNTRDSYRSFQKQKLLVKTYDPEIEAKMTEILDKIEALDWINALENGLDTEVGERGMRLSQGQRQLIAFARVLMQDPTILIMDEATSSVDPFTELQIQKAINLMMKDRTSIIIAHRLSTIRNVDRIIVLKDGKILEEGSHSVLMKNKGHYRELYDSYFKHQSLEYVTSVAKSS